MATGSYEESLSMEGIPDHHGAFSFTRSVHGWSRRSVASSDPYQTPKRRGTATGQPAGNRGRREGENASVATGVSEARSRQHRGKKTPTLVTNSESRETRSTSTVLHRRSAEAVLRAS
jgi:hypothetical protein